VFVIVLFGCVLGLKARFVVFVLGARLPAQHTARSTARECGGARFFKNTATSDSVWYDRPARPLLAETRY
jgi:hypothetical protein